MQFMRSVSDSRLGTKILTLALVLAIVPTLILGVVAFQKSRAAIEAQVDDRLEAQIDDAVRMVDITYAMARSALEAELATFRYVFSSVGSPRLLGDRMVLVAEDGARYTVNDDTVLVDRLSEMTGSAATVFQRVGESAVRISTNVYKEDGGRAVGTEVSQPVYEAVVERGETFYGVADVVGTQYITAYEPIKGPDGSVIGILFVGVTEESLYGSLWQELASIRLGESGYVYIMNETGDLVLHPTLQGENLASRLPAATEMLANRERAVGSSLRMRYEWEGRPAIAQYSFVPELGWIVASRVDPTEFLGPVRDIRNLIFSMLGLFGLLGGAAAVWMGRWVATRMGRLVAVGNAVRTGDLESARSRIGAVADEAARRDEIALVGNAFSGVIASVSDVSGELARLSAAAARGELTVRGDTSGFEGEYQALVSGLNATLDAVIAPLMVTAEYVDRIAKGDIPPRITDDYQGDFNEIKNNLNQAVDVMSSLDREISRLIQAAQSGKLDVRAEASGFTGGWGSMVDGLNNLVNAFVQPINVTAEYVDRIAKGDIPPRITDDYRGDFNEIKNNLNQAIDVMNGLSNEINRLIAAAGSGKLDVRAESADFSGGWQQLVSGLNELVNAFVQPINVTAEYVDRIAKGDIPPKITEEYQGDFNEIKNNLNQAIDVMNSLTEEINQLILAAQAGHLDERADSARFSGGWQTLVKGLNDVIEAFAIPLDEAGRVVGVMATGDLRSRMSGAYQGDFKRFEDNINRLGDSLASLIEQVNQAVGQTSTSAQAITVTAENLSVSSREQTEQSDQIATAVEDMAKTITENAMNASKTAEEAESSGRIANSGGEVLQQTIRKMRDISGVVSESATSIGKLGDSSKQIGEIISVIDDIAYQTNLLALNAAIEAARAGEQGRGFSVVADEVRRLAERTGEATKQIADMIKKIQAETEDAVVAMGRGTREVDEGISLADRAGESLHEILESIQSVLNRIRQIAQASEQQSATSEQISASVTSISQVARDTAQQVDGVATTAEEMSTLTQHLGTLMARFKVMTTA